MGRVVFIAAAFAGCLLLSASWALTSPLMAVPDEPAHVTRAVSLWQGDVLGRRLEFSNEATGQEAILFEVHVPAGFRGISDQTACFGAGGPAGCGPALVQQEGLALQNTAAGAYQPLWYALNGAPSRLLGPVAAIYGGRLLQAIAGSIFLTATLWLAGLLGGRIAVAVALLGVTPTAVFLLGAINPNGMEIAAATTLWLGIMAAVRAPQDRRVAALVVLSAFGVAWSRPLSPVIALGICVTALVLTVDRSRWHLLLASRSLQVAVVGLGLAIASAAVWVIWSGGLATFVGRPDPSLTPGVAATLSWSLTNLRLEQMVGVFGLLDVPLPAAVTWLWAVVVVVVLGGALWWGTWRQRLILVALVATTIGLPVLAETLTAARMGIVWQGRYTMPVAFGALACVVWIAADRGDRVPTWIGWVLVPVLAVTLVLGHVAGHLQTISRFSTGQGSALLAYLSDPVWSPPGEPDVLLLGATILGALLVAVTPLLVQEAPVDQEGASSGGT